MTRMRAQMLPLAISLVLLAGIQPASAGFTLFLNNASQWGFPSETEWFEAVDDVVTLDFILDPWEPLSEQYADLGVHFPGDDWVWIDPYFEDAYGVGGGSPWGAAVDVVFDEPRVAFMAKFPGPAYLEFYAGEELLYQTGAWDGPGSFPGYIGVISDTPFDRVKIIDPFGTVFVDDLYFGAAVPGPGALGVLAVGAAARGGRRRRS